MIYDLSVFVSGHLFLLLIQLNQIFNQSIFYKIEKFSEINWFQFNRVTLICTYKQKVIGLVFNWDIFGFGTFLIIM